jgi:Protein of unknown function (DUF1569)
MASIYNKTDNQNIIDRINQLTLNSQAAWGKMSVDQMFKHTTGAIEMAFGEKTIKVNFLMKLFGKMLKNKVFNSTAKEFIFTDTYDFENSKSALISNFSKFGEGENSIKTMDHPFWGKMTYQDWDKLMWKHMDHHLRQFGV